MWKRRFPKTIQSRVQTTKKESEVFTALRVNRNSNQIERSTIAPYSLFTQLSPNVKLPQLSFSLSCLQPWQTLWKNNNTSKYWSRAAVLGSRQYSRSVPAGVFILISTLIEFIYCSQCIDIFCNLGFLDYNRMISCPSFPGFTRLCLQTICNLSIN